MYINNFIMFFVLVMNKIKKTCIQTCILGAGPTDDN